MKKGRQMATTDPLDDDAAMEALAKVLVLGLMTGDRRIMIEAVDPQRGLMAGFSIRLSPIPASAPSADPNSSAV
jgi:hypothetical protein